MSKRILILSIFFFSVIKVTAQADISLETHWYNRASYNPASIVRPDFIYFFTNARKQWTGINGSPLVFNFQVSREDIVRRLSGRRSCPKCQATFHLDFAAPKVDGTCDRCGEPLMQRSDDRRDAIETRLQVYDEQTAPLVRYYDERQLLSKVDASGPVDVVFKNLSRVLATYQVT